MAHFLLVFSQGSGSYGAPDYGKTVSFIYTRKGSGSSQDDYYWVTPSDYGWMIYTAYNYNQQFTAFKPLAHRPKPMLARP